MHDPSNADNRQILEDDSHWGWWGGDILHREWHGGYYRDIWGCVADMCRTGGGLKFICDDPDVCTGDPEAQTNIVEHAWWGPWMPADNKMYLCFYGSTSPPHCKLANTILHEMFHRCGVSNEGEEDQNSATYVISEWCLSSSDCSMAPWNPCWKS